MEHVSAGAESWILPEFSDLNIIYASSVVEEFAQGHNVTDVLRELVQNEYDAQGDALQVTFGPEGLEVRGNGRVIDQDGWRRLSVMLGTGRVPGDARDIPQKADSIGSKNHGLRALFIIGDRIHVRSGGLQTLLDRWKGTPPTPIPDSSSLGIPGAQIFVPYRLAPDGRLEPYTAEREANDLDLLAAGAAPALVKLAQPGARHSVQALTVTSERTEQSLKWRQKTKQLKRLRGGGAVIERSMELRRGSPTTSALRAERIVELEYQRSFPIPERFREEDFPSYFRVAGGRVRLGLSLRLKRKRPDLNDAGSFYYPLGLTNGATGSAISVNAPFALNQDRSALLGAESSSWNNWLAETAAEFAFDLLSNEWLDTFGGPAYLLLKQHSQSPFPSFAEHLAAGLRERPCWPCRERLPNSRRPRLRHANKLMIGASPELDAILSDSRRLNERVATAEMAALARSAGAKEFSLASAIRHRCAGKDDSALKTRVPDGIGNLHYVSFPEALADLDLQKRFAAAFDAHRKHLSPANWTDLRDSPTTLTAAGTLQAPSLPLWCVEDALIAAAPVAATDRLHPDLARFDVLSRVCEPFDSSNWAAETASRASDGAITEDERTTLYRYLLANPAAIRKKTWLALRRAPIALDHRGEWAAPASMVNPRARGASSLEKGLRFPSPEILRSPELVEGMRIRSTLSGQDFIDYAHLVVEEPDLAERFEATLHQFRSRLKKPTFATLHAIPFLPSTQGLVAPEYAYLRTPFTLKCLGPDACYATGPRAALHERLGCPNTPEAADIVEYLDQLRSSGGAPPDPDVLYPALLEALRRERDTRQHADSPILWLDGSWHAPSEVLVGSRYGDVFIGGVALVKSGQLTEVFKALGAAAEPSSDHWLAFFSWVDEQSDEGRAVLGRRERRALLKAYALARSRPAAIPDSCRVFLDSAGRLHSLEEAIGKRFLINDDPGLAQAAQATSLPISFADPPDVASRLFYLSSGVALVSQAKRRISQRLGERRKGPYWFRESEVLDRLHDPNLTSAVHAVVASTGSRSAKGARELERELRRVSGIAYFSDIEQTFVIGKIRVSVPVNWTLDGHVIALRSERGKSELYGLLALAVASMAEEQEARRQPLADSVFRLLMCDGTTEMQHYLAQRGIAWGPARAASQEEDNNVIEAGERSDVVEALTDQLIRSGGAGPTPLPTEPALVRPAERERSGEPRTLPPIDQVVLEQASAHDWTPSERAPKGKASRTRVWSPRTPVEQEEDRALGERGEELVYLAELERVRELGYPENRVVWASRLDPAANHDIRSVDDAGDDIWLEVKSTSARHGRFEWSRSEFELALVARDRYVVRVFEADTDHPRVRREVDPIAKLLAGEMRLDVSNLSAEIAPLTE